MGRDKSLLEYHGVPQRDYLYKILSEVCDKVYISCNQEQYEAIPASYNPLCDDPKYGDIGPMAGLLTTFQKAPEASFLVVGCDYPFVEKPDLEELVSTYLERQTTIVYFNKDTGFTEPLLAVYHNDIRPLLIKNFELSQHSLRRALEQKHAYQLPHPQPSRLRSVDDIEAYKTVLKAMGK
jgi:molybdopterin-guanine dinucleotide biosynthesis protein A